MFRIFGHEGDDSDDIIYVNWLNMVRAGVMALEFYSPDTGAWRQVSQIVVIIIINSYNNYFYHPLLWLHCIMLRNFCKIVILVTLNH